MSATHPLTLTRASIRDMHCKNNSISLNCKKTRVIRIDFLPLSVRVVFNNFRFPEIIEYEGQVRLSPVKMTSSSTGVNGCILKRIKYTKKGNEKRLKGRTLAFSLLILLYFKFFLFPLIIRLN